MFRGVAQLVAHVVWDHGVAGSSPVTPTNKSGFVQIRFIFLPFIQGFYRSLTLSKYIKISHVALLCIIYN